MKYTKKHREQVLQRAEDNINLIIKLHNVRIEIINILRELGYSKKRSLEIFNDFIIYDNKTTKRNKRIC